MLRPYNHELCQFVFRFFLEGPANKLRNCLRSLWGARALAAELCYFEGSLFLCRNFPKSRR
jgi:hypothetical protein